MRTLPMKLFFILFLNILSTICYAVSFSPAASYEVCFTPRQHCVPLLIRTIGQAQNQIRIQAYSFTSRPMVSALIAAQKRGVDIQVLADKSQVQSEYSSILYLQQQGIKVAVDYLPVIAHNKVIVIDQSIVMTGSYNFTNAAESKNAENMLVIHDEGLAQRYLQNWQWRSEQSKALSAYHVSQGSYEKLFWMDLNRLMRDLIKWLRLLFKLQT